MDVQGDASQSSFNHLEASVNYKLWRQLYLTAGVDLYTRSTEYTGMSLKFENAVISSPIIDSKQLGLHLMLTYKF